MLGHDAMTQYNDNLIQDDIEQRLFDIPRRY